MYQCNLVKTPAIPLLSRVSSRPKCLKPSPSFLARHVLNLSGSCWETLESAHQKSLGSRSGRRPRSPCLPQASHQRYAGFLCGFHQRTRVFPSEFYYKTLRPRNFSVGCPQRSLEGKGVLKARSSSIGFHMKSLENIETWGVGIFARHSHQKTLEDDKARAGKKTLPWILANGNREGKRTERKAVVRTNCSSWEVSAESYFSRNGGKSSREDTEVSVRSAENLENSRNNYVKEDNEEEDNDVEPTDDPRWNRIKSKYNGFVNRESRFEKPEVHRWNKQENWGRKTWKEATESSVPKMIGQGVYGVGPVLAALTVGRREFYTLYVQEGLDLSGNNRKKKDKKGVEKVLRRAEKIGLKVIEASKHDLNMVVDNRPHQGLVLDASPLEIVNIKGLERASVEIQRAPLWVALDEVTDPQNLGAIIRSAYFFGAEGLVLCAKNSAPLSGVVSKASAGSLELIELRSCKNMMQFLSSSVENGWRVLGGSVSSRALPLSEVEVGVPSILVLGSEGSGLRPLVERSCNQLIRIPGNVHKNGNVGGPVVEDEETEHGCSGQELKSFLAVESLNVSVAAGVLLYHLVGNYSHIVDETPNNTFEILECKYLQLLHRRLVSRAK